MAWPPPAEILWKGIEGVRARTTPIPLLGGGVGSTPLPPGPLSWRPCARCFPLSWGWTKEACRRSALSSSASRSSSAASRTPNRATAHPDFLCKPRKLKLQYEENLGYDPLPPKGGLHGSTLVFDPLCLMRPDLATQTFQTCKVSEITYPLLFRMCLGRSWVIATPTPQSSKQEMGVEGRVLCEPKERSRRRGGWVSLTTPPPSRYAKWGGEGEGNPPPSLPNFGRPQFRAAKTY